MILRLAICFTVASALFTPVQYAATPQEELQSFATVGEVNLDKLAKGGIAMTSQTNLGIDRGMALESLYIVRAPMAVTLERSLQWNPSQSRGTNVIAHQEFGSATPAAFAGVASINAGAMKNLINLTEGLPKPSSMLNLTNEEAASYAGNPREFWIGILTRRAQSFASGGVGAIAPYEGGQTVIKPGDDLRTLLRAEPKIQRQFSGIIGASGLRGGGKAANYWELINVEGLGSFVLGAFYSSKSGESAQTLDIQYYVSGGYYAMLILQQMWPVEVNGEPATLVWRGDLISSAALAGLRGVERVGSGRAMRREIEKTIEVFRKDAQR